MAFQIEFTNFGKSKINSIITKTYPINCVISGNKIFCQRKGYQGELIVEIKILT
jgi:hypothetical protein